MFRGYLGAGLRPVKHEHASNGSQSLGSGRGVLVVSLDPDGPSVRANARRRYRERLDGKLIDRVREIMRLLGPESVGRTVKI